ncbi:dihydrodiol dehydrogenase [Natrarchaeobius oligotrophus]|uniref:Dihydrodiol dehydrogenase n=1 Tax=Natrarchaeobius chitinivorans TaxID=1679083 RepID=A0A3N6MWW7_NATCH|nr:dihydrodiol dehydrogenase [Natrarchaeobius chitinivorans]
MANEFAQVTFTRVVTENGDALALESPKLGFSIRLSVAHLESIARQDVDEFSSLLEDPYGPEDEH